LEANKYFFEINLKKKQAQEINNPKTNTINNQGEINILPKDQSKNSINLIDLLKEIKLKILNKIDKKQYLFQKSLENKIYNINKKLNPFQIKICYIKYIYKFNIKNLIKLTCPISKNSNKKYLEILNLYIKKILYLNLKKSIFLNKNHLFLLNNFNKNK
jgi:hypothetical protein